MLEISKGKKMFLWAAAGLWLAMMLFSGRAEVVHAYESEYSTLGINGTFMVKNGRLQNTKVKGGTGTATYNEASNTLTLENFTAASQQGIGISRMSGLKIQLVGNSKLQCQGGGIYADQSGSLTICGNGRLEITAGTSEAFGFGIAATGNLNVKDCTIDIKSSSGALTCNGKLDIKNADVKLKRTGVSGINDSDKNYNKRNRYPALETGALSISSSKVDVCGINYALGIAGLGDSVAELQTPQKPTLSADLAVVNENGAALKLAKLHWLEDNAYTDRYEYVYSKTAAGDIYGFEEAAAHVIIKEKPKEEPKQEEPKKNNITKNGSCYKGSPKSGKVTYMGPVNKKAASVTIPATVKIDGYTCKVTTIGKNALKGCKKLKSVKIGSNVTTIATDAFYNCTSLSKVTIPSKVTTIRSYAFGNCKKLKAVTFQGKKVKTIGKAAFKNTGNKIKISVPKVKYSCYKKLLKGKGLKNPVYQVRK